MLTRRRAILAGLVAAGLSGAAGARPAAAAATPGVGRGLEGIWSLGSYTDLERPHEIAKAPLVLSAAEAEAFEAPRRALQGMKPSRAGELGQGESEFNERGAGLMRVDGRPRSSWIVDPPDGRIPYTSAARERIGMDRPPLNFDGPEARPMPERCLSNLAAGAPMVVAPDTNLVQFLETSSAVVILTEKDHDARVIWLGDLPADPSGDATPRSWLGRSRGRWEGHTLVVETDRLREGVTFRGPFLWLSGSARITERLTRTAPGEIRYAFEVDDPELLSRPWRAEGVLTPAPGRIFEYACHEGNYGMRNILGGARTEEQAKATAASGR